jgi:hypothetical protein
MYLVILDSSSCYPVIQCDLLKWSAAVFQPKDALVRAPGCGVEIMWIVRCTAWSSVLGACYLSMGMVHFPPFGLLSNLRCPPTHLPNSWRSDME